ncbi:MAG: hypothetical protein JSV49_06965 [Thermoplasmata archaeon]|nr:MAG: hypothetical protein JSV49_06965 [Thermoplasmata archaeon]
MVHSIPLATSTNGDGDSNDSSSEDTRAEGRSTKIGDYFQLWDVTWPEYPHDGEYGNGGTGDPYTFYLNDQGNTFTIWMKNIMTEGVMEFVNTTIAVPSGVTSPITITQKYSNETNVWWSDRDQYQYEFDIGTSGAIEPFHDLEITVNMQIRVGPERFWQMGKITVKMKLTSRVTDVGGGGIDLAARNNNLASVPIYSGTIDRLLTIPNIYSLDGNLDNVEFTLSIPSNFVLEDTLATLDVVTTAAGTTEDPFWDLTSAGAFNQAPQVYSGYYELIYYIGGVKITESQNPISIEIVDTPVLDLTDQIAQTDIGKTDLNDEYIANVEIYQGTTNKSFPLVFKNNGNYDLTDVEAELFTDNAAYFFKSEFYYDENANAFKSSLSKTVPLGNIAMGQTKEENFPTEIIKNLPPGLYRIPIKYTAYYDTGGVVPEDVTEVDIHANVVAARSLTHETYTPFLLVKVNEGDDENDVIEPDLLAISTNYIQAGMHNVPLSVQLTNLENYPLNSVNVKIAAGGSSPLQQLNSLDRTAITIDAKEIDIKMYAANDPTNSNKNYFNFIVDIYKDATPGVHTVPITVTCLDPFNQERTTTVNVDLNINPVPPSCIITDAKTNDIKPNSNFTLTVTVRNVGGSDAKNVSVMFNGSTNLFSAQASIQGPQEIARNEEATFVFNIFTGEVDAGQTYSTSLFVSFEDSLGNAFQFNANPEQRIPLFVIGDDPPPPPPPPPKFVITDITTSEILEDSTFTLKVKVLNCGGSTANNVTILFNSTSNLFSASENLQSANSIDVNEEMEFTFSIKTGEIERGMLYKTSIGISFKDTQGVSYPFTAENEHSIELRSKEADPPPEPEPEEEPFLTQEMALLFLGIFILISALIFSIIHLVVSKRAEGRKVEEEMEPRAEPPAGPEEEPPPEPPQEPYYEEAPETGPPAAVFQPQQEPAAMPPPQQLPPQPPPAQAQAPAPSPAPTPAPVPGADQPPINVPYQRVDEQQQ